MDISEISDAENEDDLLSPFFNSCNDGNLIQVQYFVEQLGLNVNAQDTRGRAALHFACSRGQREVVQYLVNKGANVSISDSLGNTPIHLASISGNSAVVSLLLQSKGSNTLEFRRDITGRTPLEWAYSRLERIRNDASSSTFFGIQQELQSIVNLFSQFMVQNGRPKEDIQKMELIKGRVTNMSSTKDMDDIEAMLKSLAF